MVGRKAVSVVLSVVVFLAAIPVAGLAASVNREIASDPAKVLAEIEAMNLPDMPDELADQLRGGGGWFDLLFNLAKGMGIRWITNYTLNGIAEKYG